MARERGYANDQEEDEDTELSSGAKGSSKPET